MRWSMFFTVLVVIVSMIVIVQSDDDSDTSERWYDPGLKRLRKARKLMRSNLKRFRKRLNGRESGTTTPRPIIIINSDRFNWDIVENHEMILKGAQRPSTDEDGDMVIPDDHSFDTHPSLDETLSSHKEPGVEWSPEVDSVSSDGDSVPWIENLSDDVIESSPKSTHVGHKLTSKSSRYPTKYKTKPKLRPSWEDSVMYDHQPLHMTRPEHRPLPTRHGHRLPPPTTPCLMPTIERPPPRRKRKKKPPPSPSVITPIIIKVNLSPTLMTKDASTQVEPTVGVNDQSVQFLPHQDTIKSDDVKPNVEYAELNTHPIHESRPRTDVSPSPRVRHTMPVNPEELDEPPTQVGIELVNDDHDSHREHLERPGPEIGTLEKLHYDQEPWQESSSSPTKPTPSPIILEEVDSIGETMQVRPVSRRRRPPSDTQNLEHLKPSRDTAESIKDEQHGQRWSSSNTERKVTSRPIRPSPTRTTVRPSRPRPTSTVAKVNLRRTTPSPHSPSSSPTKRSSFKKLTNKTKTAPPTISPNIDESPIESLYNPS